MNIIPNIRSRDLIPIVPKNDAAERRSTPVKQSARLFQSWETNFYAESPLLVFPTGFRSPTEHVVYAARCAWVLAHYRIVYASPTRALLEQIINVVGARPTGIMKLHGLQHERIELRLFFRCFTSFV